MQRAAAPSTGGEWAAESPNRFRLSRDELIEAVAVLRSIREGELDRLEIPYRPLDVLAQQIVACAACEDWDEDRLFALVRSGYPTTEI